MKKRITITLDAPVAQQLQYKKNISQYINQLIIVDVFEEHKDELVSRVLKSDAFHKTVESIAERTIRSYAESRGGY